MKKVLMASIVLLLALPLVVYGAFADVPSGHWAEGYITELTGKGIISGFPDGTYQPDGTLTYGQFLKLIVAASIKGVDFDLVPTSVDHWAAPYVFIAENYEVVERGTMTKELLDQPIPRVEVIKIASLCDIAMRKHTQKTADSLTFTDIDELDIADKFMISHAVANGIIGGYPDGTLRPNNFLTRAEAAKILSVYIHL